MQRLYFKSQGLENQGATIVRDSNYNSLYLMVGKWGIKNDAVSIYSINGDVLAELKQISVNTRPKFKLFEDTLEIGQVSIPIAPARGFLYVSRLHWVILGDPITCHFRVYHGLKTILEINRVSIRNSAYIELNIYDESRIPIFLCLATILDRWIQQRPPLKNPIVTRRWNVDPKTSYNNFSKEHQDLGNS